MIPGSALVLMISSMLMTPTLISPAWPSPLNSLSPHHLSWDVRLNMTKPGSCSFSLNCQPPTPITPISVKGNAYLLLSTNTVESSPVPLSSYSHPIQQQILEVLPSKEIQKTIILTLPLLPPQATTVLTFISPSFLQKPPHCFFASIWALHSLSSAQPPDASYWKIRSAENPPLTAHLSKGGGEASQQPSEAYKLYPSHSPLTSTNLYLTPQQLAIFIQHPTAHSQGGLGNHVSYSCVPSSPTAQFLFHWQIFPTIEYYHLPTSAYLCTDLTLLFLLFFVIITSFH